MILLRFSRYTGRGRCATALASYFLQKESATMKQRLNSHRWQRRQARGAWLVLLAAAALVAGGAASQPARTPPSPSSRTMGQTAAAPAGVMVSLPCAPQTRVGIATRVTLTNTTGHTLPSGTRVHWQTAGGIVDWVQVSAPRGWPPEAELTGTSGDWLRSGPCTAHVFLNSP